MLVLCSLSTSITLSPITPMLITHGKEKAEEAQAALQSVAGILVLRFLLDATAFAPRWDEGNATSSVS